MKLVLFDIDGTLIRSHGVGRRAFGRAVTQVLGLADPFVDFCFGGLTDPIIVAHVLSTARIPVERRDEVTAALYSSYLGFLERGLSEAKRFEVLPGARPLVERLGKTGRHALALGTGNIEDGARLKLQRGGLDHLFPTGGFGSDATDRSDVLAAGWRKAQAHYGGEFDDVWVIGDTIRDIQAARDIGARVIAVATGTNSADELGAEKPDLLVESLEDPTVNDPLLGGS